jgi:hypothetical protein
MIIAAACIAATPFVPPPASTTLPMIMTTVVVIATPDSTGPMPPLLSSSGSPPRPLLLPLGLGVVVGAAGTAWQKVTLPGSGVDDEDAMTAIGTTKRGAAEVAVSHSQRPTPAYSEATTHSPPLLPSSATVETKNAVAPAGRQNVTLRATQFAASVPDGYVKVVGVAGAGHAHDDESAASALGCTHAPVAASVTKSEIQDVVVLPVAVVAVVSLLAQKSTSSGPRTQPMPAESMAAEALLPGGRNANADTAPVRLDDDDGATLVPSGQ